MKIRVSYTIDLTDDEREAINAYFGIKGKATRQTIRKLYETRGVARMRYTINTGVYLLGER
jgi:hypothetical protein